MRFLIRLVFLLLVLIAGAWAVAYLGWYNVSALEPHSKFVKKFLVTVSNESVGHHAKSIVAPGNLGDTAVLHEGFEHYQEMCVQCHAAPGMEASEMAEGLNPHPPHLFRTANFMTPSEVFWITKNGIKMTGMPGFGPTHTDEQIWAITAFVKQLPTLDSASYAALKDKWCEKGGEEDADCKRAMADCEHHPMDCERQSDGTSHSHDSHGPPEAISAPHHSH